MPISVETYEQVALEDGDVQWELECGRLRAKPIMTMAHGFTTVMLQLSLARQLDENEYLVFMNTPRLRISSGTFYVPDVVVIPRKLNRRLLAEQPRRLEVYEEPVPLVVEVWSPSTGEYDVETKLREYQFRGDAEIWRVHPYERTVTAWRRQPDGSYSETLFREGMIEPVALPGVRIELRTLFEA